MVCVPDNNRPEKHFCKCWDGWNWKDKKRTQCENTICDGKCRHANQMCYVDHKLQGNYGCACQHGSHWSLTGDNCVNLKKTWQEKVLGRTLTKPGTLYRYYVIRGQYRKYKQVWGKSKVSRWIPYTNFFYETIDGKQVRWRWFDAEKGDPLIPKNGWTRYYRVKGVWTRYMLIAGSWVLYIPPANRWRYNVKKTARWTNGLPNVKYFMVGGDWVQYKKVGRKWVPASNLRFRYRKISGRWVRWYFVEGRWRRHFKFGRRWLKVTKSPESGKWVRGVTRKIRGWWWRWAKVNGTWRRYRQWRGKWYLRYNRKNKKWIRNYRIIGGVLLFF
jgi:hypothetical protein